ncbi:MAG: hypothetical protein A2W26_00875 [Acidobacteria bacterium RBG_16_64_8]|nr:MAG: hypothetical protein A2W26_00875 [Acidobacteria bacterium RBG_16_64_8]
MRTERGFTILEILVALAIFAILIVGGLGVIGATNSSLVQGLPTGIVLARSTRDMTAASVYVQAFMEYTAATGAAAVPDGTYCLEPPGPGCSSGTPLPGSLGVFPTPSSQPYQLDWTRFDVIAESWYWDAGNMKYCRVGSPGCGALSSTESIKWVRSTLFWTLKGVQRSVRVERFLP